MLQTLSIRQRAMTPSVCLSVRRRKEKEVNDKFCKPKQFIFFVINLI